MCYCHLWLIIPNEQNPKWYTPDSQPTVFTHSVLFLPHYLLFCCVLQPAVTEVNPQSVVVCVWTFETNGHRLQSRDNPSRLCKYQSARLELNVNALIWNANCVLCDMSKHWRAALWDGKTESQFVADVDPSRPFDYCRSTQPLAPPSFSSVCG